VVPTPKESAPTGRRESVFGPGVTIEGKIEGDADIRIGGKFKGDIQIKGDLNLDKTSYGVGLRVHSRTSTLARLDVARSREGWRMSFKLSDPFRLARRS
jgi:hypothetical protein